MSTDAHLHPSGVAIDAAFAALINGRCRHNVAGQVHPLAFDAVEAAYPIIRADVVAEVVAVLRAIGNPAGYVVEQHFADLASYSKAES